MKVIGEIVKRLPPTLRDDNPQIDWPTLAKFRDFLAHNYDEVILQNVWVAVQNMPEICLAVEALIAALPDDEMNEN